MRAFTEKYGPTVRIRPNIVVFSSPQAFKDIYSGTNNAAFLIYLVYYNAPINGVHSILTARRRRLFAPGFTKEALGAQEPVLRRYVAALMGRLEAGAETGAVAVGDWFVGFTFDLTSERAHVHAVKSFPALDWVLIRVMPEGVRKMQCEHFKLSAAKANRRIESGTGGAVDMLSPALERGVSELTKQISFIISGSETTAVAMAGMPYYLCKNPSVMNTLVSEIRSSFVDEKTITLEVANKQQYLNPMTREILRIYPPFAARTHRLARKGRDYIDGRFAPVGSSLTTMPSPTPPPNFALLREFYPERWLGTDARFTNDQLDAVRPWPEDMHWGKPRVGRDTSRDVQHVFPV
ncbi:cytochrome P450 [Bimuria novae-zelandiae CBS 107.79]|uniref:Cytochrome P450 n=1 Tax=Bimuria novae-zelandiae CBS 107.79 TaxID=1447943 RepID=A0A6A5UTE6_9PLEO|nr:cytochrome P450 [Bimuria novae-zelandiae CBS 107.79]